LEESQNNQPVAKMDTHNAVSSWSGYDYQGRVAIYWALCVINEKVDLDYTDYELEIENLEDFTIRYKGNPISIHQVKSNQDKNTFNPYKEAVLELMGKCAKYGTITAMHLHTCCTVNVPNKHELKKQLQETIPKKKVEQFKEYKELLFEQDKFDETYSKLFINNQDGCSSKRVLGLTEVEYEIKKQIEEFYRKNCGFIETSFVDSEENINFIYHNLVYEINQFVALRHKKELKYPIISFKTFEDILKYEFVFKFSKKTAASMLKCLLEDYFIQYCEIEDPDSALCENWNNNWNKICLLNDDEFLLLCKKLTPTENFNTEKITPSNYRELLVKSGVHKTLIPMVLEAGGFALKVEGVKDLFVLNKEGIHHLITTIAEVPGKYAVSIHGKRVFNALKDDNELATMLFDIHKLITNELEGTFYGNILDIRKAYQEFDQEQVIKEPITLPKTMEFITVQTAKGEFI
jgi:hypothetical protein